MRRTCWSFTSRGLCTVGQDDVVVLMECLPDETLPPTDVFQHVALLYEQASQGLVSFCFTGVEWIGITERSLYHSCVISLMHSKRRLRKEALFVQRLIISCLSLTCSSKARVNDGSHSFTCHPHILITSGMNHTSLHCPATEHHHTLADTHFPPF